MRRKSYVNRASIAKPALKVQDRRMSVTHCIVLAGGRGRRLGGVSKADIAFGGRRLLERVVADVGPFVTGRIVAVAPETVEVPNGVLRTLEDPPNGGPLAGIDAGLGALSDFTAERSDATRDMVLVFAVDTPLAGSMAPRLAEAADGREGAVVVGGKTPFRQYLQAIYRVESLTAAVRKGGDPRNRGVRNALRGMDLVEVPVVAEECRDVDTPEDVAWWNRTLERGRPASNLVQLGDDVGKEGLDDVESVPRAAGGAGGDDDQGAGAVTGAHADRRA